MWPQEAKQVTATRRGVSTRGQVSMTTRGALTTRMAVPSFLAPRVAVVERRTMVGCKKKVTHRLQPPLAADQDHVCIAHVWL